MICDNCKYWQPVYAKYIKRLVPCCTKKSIDANIPWELDKCRFFERNDNEQTDTLLLK